MKSDKSFFEFLRSGGLARILPLLICGVLMLMLGSRMFFGDGGEQIVAQASAEDELAELCSAIEGVGRCRIMLTEDEDGRVCAVAVLCDGAGSVSVRKSVTELMTSLYGIGANRISILKYQ